MEQNPAVLRGKNEGIINYGEEGNEEGSQRNRGFNQATSTTPQFYNWVSLIKAVSQLTLWDFDKTLKKSAIEFFAFASFVIYEKEREKKMIEDFRKGIKH